MLFSSELIHITAETIRKHKLSRLVVDPVIAATSGSGLIQADAVETLTRELFPLALVITPNLPETEILTGLEIRDQNDMVRALDILCNQFPSAIFVIKGGHLPDQAVDWYGGNGLTPGKLVSPLYAQVNNHGSGCSFASAIAAFLAKDFAAEDALRQAKAFISDALANPLELHGQVRLINHLWSSSKAG